MTRRAPLAPVSVPVSIALVMLALGALLLAQGQTPPTPQGAQNPGAVQPAGAPDATAKITGQVLAADTSLPVKRATVRARGGTPQPPPAGTERVPLQGRRRQRQHGSAGYGAA